MLFASRQIGLMEKMGNCSAVMPCETRHEPLITSRRSNETTDKLTALTLSRTAIITLGTVVSPLTDTARLLRLLL